MEPDTFRHSTDAVESKVGRIKISHWPGMLKMEHDRKKFQATRHEKEEQRLV